VPLDRLGLEPALREALDPLGVKTVGDFLRLPGGGLLARFGPEAHRLHRLAAGDLWAPLRPVHPEEPRERRTEVEPPDADAERLLFLGKRLLDSLLPALHARGEAVQALALRLAPDRGEPRIERVSPAAPTLDGLQLARLLRLKLESLRLDTPVADMALVAEVVPVTAEQLRLTAPEPRRDPSVRARALARLRAALGEGAVTRARLLDAHLPGARFEWQPVEHCGLRIADCGLKDPEPRRQPTSTQGNSTDRKTQASRSEQMQRRASATIRNPQSAIRNRALVRRLYREPRPLPARPRQGLGGWLPCGAEAGPATGLRGPYRFSGGWWQQEEEREYYFVTLAGGDVLWVFRDPRRRRWFLQGRVE
jgi:protein ImuB